MPAEFHFYRELLIRIKVEATWFEKPNGVEPRITALRSPFPVRRSEGWG